MQSLKTGLRKTAGGTIETKLSRFLFIYTRYRLTPHATTGQPPAVMLMGRCPRSHLDILYPDQSKCVVQSQDWQKSAHDKRFKDRRIKDGNTVREKNFAQGPQWLNGTVLRKLGPCSFLIHLDDGREVHKHIDHLCPRVPETTSPPMSQDHNPAESCDFELDPQLPVPTLERQHNTKTQTEHKRQWSTTKDFGQWTATLI